MNDATAPLFVLLLIGGVSAACAGAQQPAPSPEPAHEPAPAAESGGDAGAPLTAAACKAAGGEVVGDIGDGAIHRPDYRCPGSGAAPLGSIAAEAGQPMAVEGAVCCR